VALLDPDRLQPRALAGTGDHQHAGGASNVVIAS
jgi:hypothetical protein